MAKMLLDKAGVEYTTIDAEDNIDLVNKFNMILIKYFLISLS